MTIQQQALDQEKLPPLVRAASCCAVLALGALLPLPGDHGQIARLPDICSFRRITGIPCPGCGMTRSIVCLMHGRLAESWSYHPLGWLVAAALLVFGLIDVARWRGLAVKRPIPLRARAYLPYFGIVVFLGVWAARLSGWDSLPR